MATQVQWRGGSTAEHATFTGAAREVTVDTQKQTLVVHDGSTVGGAPLQKQYPPLGSAAAPTYTFTGDTNTGIYSPGADQVAVATNGTGRVFVDASGNVGIGATPNSYAGYSTLTINNTTGSELDFEVNGTLTSDIYTDSAAAYWTTRTAVPIVLRTNSTERLRITSAGNVGIGTSTPGTYLSIAATATDPTGFEGSAAFSINSNLSPKFQLGVGTGTIGYSAWIQNSVGTTTYPLSLQPLGGNVGIGTTSPGSALEVKAAAPVLTVNSAVANASSIVLQENGTTYARFRFDGNNVDIGNLYVNGATIFNAGNAERARIDSSGRLLVGTSSARINFQVGIATTQFETANPNFNQGLSIINNGGTSGYDPTLTLGATRGTSVGSNTAIPSAGYGLGRVDFAGADGTNLLTGARIQGLSDGVWGTNDGPSALLFSTTAAGASSPTERMRITNNGTLSAFASIGDAIIGATGSAAGSVATVFGLNHSATSTTTGTTCLYVLTNGDVRNTNNSYGAISDIKLKENIVDANSQWDDIKSFKVRKYNFKREANQQTHTQIGLVAQEAELVSPGLVSASPDRDAEGSDLGTVTKSVNYSVLYMKAVKALQEAMERIEVLEQRLNDAGIN
jgi:hypothetical protein